MRFAHAASRALVGCRHRVEGRSDCEWALRARNGRCTQSGWGRIWNVHQGRYVNDEAAASELEREEYKSRALICW